MCELQPSDGLAATPLLLATCGRSFGACLCIAAWCHGWPPGWCGSVARRQFMSSQIPPFHCFVPARSPADPAPQRRACRSVTYSNLCTCTCKQHALVCETTQKLCPKKTKQMLQNFFRLLGHSSTAPGLRERGFGGSCGL